eukprot:Trichotokara_eunicae@DN4940_c0_g1_i2.p1
MKLGNIVQYCINKFFGPMAKNHLQIEQIEQIEPTEILPYRDLVEPNVHFVIFPRMGGLAPYEMLTVDSWLTFMPYANYYLHLCMAECHFDNGKDTLLLQECLEVREEYRKQTERQIYSTFHNPELRLENQPKLKVTWVDPYEIFTSTPLEGLLSWPRHRLFGRFLKSADGEWSLNTWRRAASQIVNLVRVAVLYKMGGLYMDTDQPAQGDLMRLARAQGPFLTMNSKFSASPSLTATLNNSLLALPKGSKFLWMLMVAQADLSKRYGAKRTFQFLDDERKGLGFGSMGFRTLTSVKDKLLAQGWRPPVAYGKPHPLLWKTRPRKKKKKKKKKYSALI